MKVGILGIGKLGLCFALHLEKNGYQVTGVDVSNEYVSSINNKTLSSSEPFVTASLRESKNLTATCIVEDVLQDDVSLLFVFVATPSLQDGSYDHSQVESIAAQLVKFGKRKYVTDLVIGCTTMPGYCNNLAEKLKPYNYRVSYNPEFIAQGSIMHNLVNPDQVLIGEADKEAGDIIQHVYSRVCENEPNYCRMDRLSAEITKLATNCFLTTKIAFANAVGDLAIRTGADYEKILWAVGADSRIGNKYLKYGFGFGGPCFPRDNRALSLFAAQNDFEWQIGKATDLSNQNHLEEQFRYYMETYDANSEIVFDYVTYKKDSVLLEESQQLALAVKLAKAGRKVVVKERKEVANQLNNLYPGLFQIIEL